MDRRDMLRSAAGLVAVSAFSAGPARATDADTCGRVAKPATFVLVHGAWCGGFVYDETAAILRKRGHRVFTPTLTGLGDRSHLLTSATDLTTHITDIANLIRFEKLSNIVLAGHSYGGMVVTGVADKMADRIASLVYLDAAIPSDGDSVAKLNAGTPLGQLIDTARAKGETTMPMPPEVAALFKIPQADRWRYLPQPIAAVEEPIRLSGAQKTIAKKTLVRAGSETDPGAILGPHRADPSWTGVGIDTGHMLMLEAPERTAEILENAA